MLKRRNHAMLELGKKQKLIVVKKVDFGIYLGEEKNASIDDRVLLPKKQVPQNCEIGDEIEVFLYKDSSDRIIATTSMPKLMLGEVGKLKVSQITPIGAFLDWGLEKDILLPYREQTLKFKEGDEVLVAVYIDKSSRLAATMNVYNYLKTDSPYKKDDMVTGTLYQIYGEAGAYVAVDDTYSAMIPKREMFGDIKAGQAISARVSAVKPDGKLDLSVREKAHIQMEKDAQILVDIMQNYGGILPFTDKASPELIRKKTDMSKNEFKRAVGNLLKNGKISIEADCIRLKQW